MLKESASHITMQKKLNAPLFLSFALAATSCTDGNGHLTDWGIGVVFGAIGMALFFIWILVKWNKSKKEKRQAVKDALKERTDFTESKVIKGEGGNYYYLATDEERKKVFYVYGDKKLLFDYKDVVAVNIKENGTIISSKKSFGSALAGAIIGEAVLGGDKGALIGAATFGKTTQQKQITSMYVHVLLNNQPLSSLDFKCFENDGEPLPQALYRLSYESATIKAKELYDLFQGIIEEVDANRREEEERADALRKEEMEQVKSEMQRIIAAQEMLDAAGQYLNGQLSDEEFAKMKKIIGKE